MRLSFYGKIEVTEASSAEGDVNKMERIERAIEDALSKMDDVEVEFVEVEA